MNDSKRLNNLLIKLTENEPKLSELSSSEGESIANIRLSYFDEAVMKKILVSKQMISNKDEQAFVEFVSGGVVLHFVAFVGSEDGCEWLLKNGAYPHSTNARGNTPLHSAASSNQTDCIKTLKYYHADIYIENKEGKTPLDVAQGNDESKESLLSVRFPSEEVETEFLQERLPQLLDKVLASKTDPEEKEHCLKCLRAEMRMATSSMTSVPKPLKILREKYDTLKEAFDALDPSQVLIRQLIADVLSMLATAIEDQEKGCLKYRLLGSSERVDSFGHPYIRRLCLQIPAEWNAADNTDEQLSPLVSSIIQYCLNHNAEEEACDLLMEVEWIDKIVEFVTVETHERVCLYLTSCVKYVPEPEDSVLLKTTMSIYRKFNKYPQALRLALMLNDLDLSKEIFLECPDLSQQKQLAFMLGRQQIYLELDDSNCSEPEDLTEIMQNVHLNNNFLGLARELDIMAPKQPEDIYKTHLEHARFSTAQPLDSARANLASSFVNGFVNCGFGQDQLVMDDGSKWLYKHKSYGMLSAAASIGLVLLWDVEGGLTEIDKFLYSTEDYIKAGALLACGVVNCGVRNECEPALALLTDYIQHESNVMRLGAIIGLGLAYAGSYREDVIDLLTPVLWDSNSTFEVVCLAALSCSMIAIGSCHGDLGESILQIMMDPERLNDLSTTHSRYLALALALLYLGKQESVEAVLVAIQAVPEPFSSFASVLLQICAYAGTGNVLKIQSLLHLCSEYFGDKEDETAEPGEGGEKGSEGNKKGTETGGTKRKSKSGDEKDGGKKEEKTEPGSLSEPGSHQALAVLGIALISMGEDIGSQMALRTFNHLLRYGEPVIRRAVPLALALLSTSNPVVSVLDTLSKFSHDSDSTVARNAIFAMGILGSGTNNARLAGLLRNLAQFYHKEPLDLFMVRLAQGLTHLGKGTLTLNPFHSDKGLVTPVSVGGLLTVMLAMLDSANTILSTSHYMMYYLVPAVHPRMLVTFDENLSPLSISVRVGQAVDVVGQAGRPKTITGFQTHTTPVLLAHGERAELATNEYIPLSPIIEGFVILRKNPDYSED